MCLCACACVRTCVCDIHYTMQVLNFVQQFADMLPDYEIACEHEHSNCVLIAHKKVHSSLHCVHDVKQLTYFMSKVYHFFHSLKLKVNGTLG